jgi:hypothetical protein
MISLEEYALAQAGGEVKATDSNQAGYGMMSNMRNIMRRAIAAAKEKKTKILMVHKKMIMAAREHVAKEKTAKTLAKKKAAEARAAKEKAAKTQSAKLKETAAKKAAAAKAAKAKAAKLKEMAKMRAAEAKAEKAKADSKAKAIRRLKRHAKKAQQPKYTCPASAPMCTGYRPGHSWGKCTSHTPKAVGSCKDGCSPTGALKKNKLCTATYCNQYKKGGKLFPRCNPRNGAHHYALNECAATCGLTCGAAAVPRPQKNRRKKTPKPNLHKDYIGCYKDTPKRQLKVEMKTRSLTAEQCTAACGKHFQYVALQGGGKTCWCGNNLGNPSIFTKVPDAQCNLGKGGKWRNAVYKNPSFTGMLIPQRSCKATIPNGVSGYCLCGANVKVAVRWGGVGCKHPGFTCEARCKMATSKMPKVNVAKDFGLTPSPPHHVKKPPAKAIKNHMKRSVSATHKVHKASGVAGSGVLMASVYLGYDLLKGDVYFYASLLQTSLANAVEACAGKKISKHLPSWMGKIAIGGFNHQACVAAEKRGDYGNPACFAILSFATVPTVVPIHPPINIAMGLTVSLGIEVFGTFSGLYINVAPTKGIFNMKLLGPCLHLAGGKLILARSPTELHKGPLFELDIGDGAFKGVADCYIKVGIYVTGWFDLTFSKTDFKFFAGLFLMNGEIGADIKASVNPKTHLPNFISVNIYLGPIGKLIEHIIDLLKKPVLAILHGINNFFQGAKRKLAAASRTVNHDLANLNRAKEKCNKASAKVKAQKAKCDKILVVQTELDMRPSWSKGGQDDPFQASKRRARKPVVVYWEPSNTDKEISSKELQVALRNEYAMAPHGGSDDDLLQMGYGSPWHAMTHAIHKAVHAVVHVVKKCAAAIKKGLAMACKGVLNAVAAAAKKLCYAGVAIAKVPFIIAQKALAVIRKIIDKIAAVVKVGTAKAAAFVESIEFDLQYLGFAVDFQKGKITLKAEVALGKNAKPKMYKLVIDPMVVLKAFKHIGEVMKKAILDPIANFAKKEMKKLWDSIKHVFVAELDRLVQEVDDSHQTGTDALQPIHDASDLIERFDDEYANDPEGVKDKIERLNGSKRTPKANKVVDWSARWALIEHQGTVKKKVLDPIDKCQHHCKDDAGKDKCNQCLDDKNHKAAASTCNHVLKHADADEDTKKIAYNTCKKKVGAALKKNKDLFKINSKCAGKTHGEAEGKCLINAMTEVCLAKTPTCKVQKIDFHTCEKTPSDKCCVGLKACAGKITHNPDIADEENFGDAQTSQFKKDGQHKELSPLEQVVDTLVQKVAKGGASQSALLRPIPYDLVERAKARVQFEQVLVVGDPKDIDPTTKCKHSCHGDAGKDGCAKCMDDTMEATAHEQCRRILLGADADDETKVIAFGTCKKKVKKGLKRVKTIFQMSSRCPHKHSKHHELCLTNALTETCLAENPTCKVQHINFAVCRAKPNNTCCKELKECAGRIFNDPDFADKDDLGDTQARQHKPDGKHKELEL